MTKITDLRKEVKERLERKSITDLTEMKLRRIKLGKGVKKATTKNGVNRMMVRIGKSLINPILNKDMPTNNKLKEIEKITNTGDISVSIKQINKVDHEKEEAIEILKSAAKNKANDDVFLEVTVTDKDEEVHTYSWLNFDAKASNEGYFRFRRRGAISYPITGLNKVIGTVYLANAMNKYYRNNKEMADITILKYAELVGLYKDEEQLKHLQELMDDLNIKKKINRKTFLSDYTSSKEHMKENGTLQYIEWLDNKEFFTISSIYGTPAKRYPSLCIFDKPDLIAFFANFLIELNTEEEYEVRTSRKLSSDYARSFETKKNIPQATLDKMKKTLFLKHFGYVEFDESVDLEKIEIIEKEWIEINKKLNFPIAKDHSLRFRRLGNHNASGLYFPQVKAVCVDLRSPESMIHEVLHMVDYKNGEDTLSSLYDFRGIVESYREITNEQVDKLDDEDEFKKRWQGRSKYNKDYFQSSKEIFARCGEIYIDQILGISSSLVNGKDNGILYPEDKDLHALIENYYSKVIKEVKNKESNLGTRIYSESAMAETMSREAVANILKNNQISIF